MIMLILIAVVNILQEFDSCMIVCELLSSGNYLYALWLNCLDSRFDLNIYEHKQLYRCYLCYNMKV